MSVLIQFEDFTTVLASSVLSYTIEHIAFEQSHLLIEVVSGNTLVSCCEPPLPRQPPHFVARLLDHHLSDMTEHTGMTIRGNQISLADYTWEHNVREWSISSPECASLPELTERCGSLVPGEAPIEAAIGTQLKGMELARDGILIRLSNHFRLLHRFGARGSGSSTVQLVRRRSRHSLNTP